VCLREIVTFADGLGSIHYFRLGDLLGVGCDEGGRARWLATVPSTIVRAVPLGVHTFTAVPFPSHQVTHVDDPLSPMISAPGEVRENIMHSCYQIGRVCRTFHKVRLYIYIFIYVYVYIYIYVCVCVCVYLYIYIYTHT